MEIASAPPREGAPVRVVTDADVVERLWIAVAAAGSQAAFAAEASVNASDLGQALRGRRAPTRQLRRSVGVELALVVIGGDE
jgi:hypothetical protein